MATGTTDANGIVLFEGLTPGQYTVDVVPDSDHQDVPNQVVTVVPNQVAEARFALPSKPGGLKVTVIDLATGQPRSGLQVIITAQV